jgi:hypothetical protein
MNFFQKIFGTKIEKDNSHVYKEKDNIGTRILTADRYWASCDAWYLNGSPAMGAIYYSFKTKNDAYAAIREIPCIKVASDSKNLICLEIIEFGIFLNTDNNNSWDIFLQGPSLSISTHNEAKKSFIKHNGKKIVDTPPINTKKKQNNNVSESDELAGKTVIFVRNTVQIVQGFTCTKDIYEAPNKSMALEYLKSKNVNKQYYYIEIETPEGWVGKDIDGIYET